MSERFKEIFEIFNSLETQDSELINIFEEHSIKPTDEIAKSCAIVSNSVNSILKLYSDITEMNDKVKIKAHLKFYYELITKLMYFLKSVENFQQISEEYYDQIIEFLEKRYILINGKYTSLAKNELDTFYSEEKKKEIEFFLEKRLKDPYKPKKI